MRIFGTQLDKLLPNWFVLGLIAVVILAPFLIADTQPAATIQAVQKPQIKTVTTLPKSGITVTRYGE